MKRLRGSQNMKGGKSASRDVASKSSCKDNDDLRDLLVIDAQKLKQKNNVTTISNPGSQSVSRAGAGQSIIGRNIMRSVKGGRSVHRNLEISLKIDTTKNEE